MNNDTFQLVLKHIAAIREEHDINKRITMLQELNNLLPIERRIELPSLITNAYIRTVLDIIRERAIPPIVSA
jgi:hypothetical protein